MLLESVDLEHLGTVQWGSKIPAHGPGVYLVSISDDPSRTFGMRSARISSDRVNELMKKCPQVTIDGKPATAQALIDRLEAMWIQDTTVMYIGKARTSIASRVAKGQNH